MSNLWNEKEGSAGENRHPIQPPNLSEGASGLKLNVPPTADLYRILSLNPAQIDR